MNNIPKRHTHTAINSQDGGETCGSCGKNFRNPVHYRTGESHKTDLERARAAIAKATGEPTQDEPTPPKAA